MRFKTCMKIGLADAELVIMGEAGVLDAGNRRQIIADCRDDLMKVIKKLLQSVRLRT